MLQLDYSVDTIVHLCEQDWISLMLAFIM